MWSECSIVAHCIFKPLFFKICNITRNQYNSSRANSTFVTCRTCWHYSNNLKTSIAWRYHQPASSETDVTPIYVSCCKFARWHGARVPMRRRLGTFGILNLTALDAGSAGDAAGMSFPPVIAFAPAPWLQINVASYVPLTAARPHRFCVLSRLDATKKRV